MLRSDGFHLGATLCHILCQLHSHLLGLLVHWGGDFKQAISTGAQLTLYNCTVLNWPSHTTSLQPVGDKKRREEEEEQGNMGGEWGTAQSESFTSVV